MSGDDRNFDDLVDHFQTRIYGSLKGRIRQAVIWRDLKQVLDPWRDGAGRRLLDVGGGLGHVACEFAQHHYTVTYNDISHEMFKAAKVLAREQGVENNIQWQCGPYQALLSEASLSPTLNRFSERSNSNDDHMAVYDVVVCHAVLEWLAKPDALISHLRRFLKPGGILSLCFYNPVSMVYRNLLYGNFKRLLNDGYVIQGGLTPTSPCERETVLAWLEENGFTVTLESGIRVFSDYVREKRGGNAVDEDVIQMELDYSQKEPYKKLGRYIHVIACLD